MKRPKIHDLHFQSMTFDTFFYNPSLKKTSLMHNIFDNNLKKPIFLQNHNQENLMKCLPCIFAFFVC